MSSSYNTPCSKYKLVMSIYSNTETSLAMSTLAIWCRVVQSRDVRSRVFSRPTGTTVLNNQAQQATDSAVSRSDSYFSVVTEKLVCVLYVSWSV